MGKGRLIILTGPSGVGKGTILRLLLDRHPDIYLSVSATTRAPRSGEVDGRNYFFLTHAEFERMIAAGEFLEWAEFAGNYYGTPKRPVIAQIDRGQWVLLEIELQGARQVAEQFPEAFRVFLAPPSFEELEQRIRQRGQDSEASIQQRLAKAKQEVHAADEFDLRIVNDDLDQAIAQLEDALFAVV